MAQSLAEKDSPRPAPWAVGMNCGPDEAGDSGHPGDADDPRGPDAPPRPRTALVLCLLALTAATFSYLGSYALTDALVAAEVISPWPRDADPRPRWMGQGFVVLLGTFLLVGGGFRWLGGRQMRRIEQSEQHEA